MPISKARAAYWSGRAYAQMKNKEQVMVKFKAATIYPEIFYGQVTLLTIGHDKNIVISSLLPKPTHPDHINFKQNNLAKAGLGFMKLDKDALARLFVETAVKNSSSPGEILLITDLGIKSNKTLLSVEAARVARFHHHLLFAKHIYPII